MLLLLLLPQDGKFAAGGDSVTLADLCLLATYSTLKATGFMDMSTYKNIEAWEAKVIALVPNYEKVTGPVKDYQGLDLKSSFLFTIPTPGEWRGCCRLRSLLQVQGVCLKGALALPAFTIVLM